MRSHRSAALAAFAALTALSGAWAADKSAALPVADPVAVLGEPYTAEGVTYAPADSAFDDVGYAGRDDAAGPSISVSHRTLPLPSYVEVTALDSGRTILARVERRGPMSGRHLVALSAAGFAQLGADPAQPLAVRVRRTNPQEYERALLRTNQRAPERLMTPGSLLEVLRKLLIGKSNPAPVAADDPNPVAIVPVGAALPIKRTPIKPVAAKPVLAKAVVAKPVLAKPIVAKPDIVKPVGAKLAITKPVVEKPAPAKASPALASKPPVIATFSIQVGTFANRAHADSTAKKLTGMVSGSGKFWRVRLGPFDQRALAEAGLARAKKAGFGDARIVTAGK